MVHELTVDGFRILSMWKIFTFSYLFANEWQEFAKIIRSHMKETLTSNFFKMATNFFYIGSYPEPKFYLADFLYVDVRTQSSVFYNGKRQNI
jgi:hypothetical protein